MAKKIMAVVRLRIPTDRHHAGPAESRALGRRGVDMAAFSRAFQALKPDDGGSAVPVIVTIYDDRSFALVIGSHRDHASHEQALMA
ncbi:MAG: hypothetical protein ACKOYJ_08355 [Planctomycetia bacterium]